MAAEDPRRRLPSVERMLRRPPVRELERRHGREPLLRELRALLAEARQAAGGGDLAQLEEDLPRRLAERLRGLAAPSLRVVVNATGVVVHTNLGRSPLARSAAGRIAEAGCSYSNLEYDLAEGARGEREVHAESRLRRLLGVEASLVVNNNAAAVLLAVNSLAEGREVVVSRGELVEIGGSFRLPDVIRKAGARLREVGTTNRTRLSDYRGALGPETALLLKVHPSNFRVVGFTESVPLAELTALGREAGLPVAEDMGSGLLAPLPPPLHLEPTVAASLGQGADLVTFSGDKLLGGPQAGLVVGRAEHLSRMRRNPLYRALRVDKVTIAALDAVLADHEAGRADEVPALRLLRLPAEAVRSRAAALLGDLAGSCPDYAGELRDGASAVGGGAAPGVEVATVLLSLAHRTRSAEALAAALRRHDPPVVARVAEGRLLLDLRTVFPEQDAAVLGALRAASQAE